MTIRKEIEELLKTDWGKLPMGISEVTGAILKLQPTEDELRELGNRLDSCKDEDEAMVMMSIMQELPRDFFVGHLLRALESSNRIVSSVAAGVLLEGQYAGAVEYIIASKTAIKSLGDNLPRKMLRYAENLPTDKQRILLDQFFRRVSEHPPLEAGRDWLKMVSMIFIQDKRLTPILLETWREMPGGSDWLYDRLALLDAMATHPDPLFKPAFEKAAKSRDEDIRAIGKTGLYVLSEVAQGRWPFDRPAK